MSALSYATNKPDIEKILKNEATAMAQNIKGPDHKNKTVSEYS